MDGKVKHLIETSKIVIHDCALKNGSLVAANPTKSYYHHEAAHYYYVWPRDAAFTCMAAKAIGISNIQEPFFDWIINRAEDIDENGNALHHQTGLLYQNYYINGPQAHHHFQPDQGGTLLFAIENYYNHDPERTSKYYNLITDLADNICKRWKKDHFDIVTNDLWEERHTFPDIKDNFSYALAACAAGLKVANNLFSNQRYLEVAEEMKQLLLTSAREQGYFYRSFGRLNDDRLDASLLGIIWPFNIIDPNDDVSRHTVDLIIKRLVRDDGVYRYEQDEYDGWIYRGIIRKKGAGYWPLLNFWLAIVLKLMSRKEEAERYYYKAVSDVPEGGFIAEQIFNNQIQKAVSPLCWSHSMFILATKELGLGKYFK